MTPEGWTKVRVDDVLSLEYGKSLPSRERNEGSVPVFGSAGVIDSHDEALVEGPGIILGRKGSIGEATWSKKAFWPIDTTYFVVPGERLDLRYCYYVLRFRDLEALNRATGIPGLNRHDVGALSLLLPPVREQRKIAAILSKVDDAIAATRAVIEQIKRVKKGLIQTLMTRGIGHSHFKDTKIGEIPEKWDVVTLEELLAPVENPMRSGPFGSALLKEELVDNGIPLLGIDNIHVEEFRRTYTRFVSDEKFAELERFAVRPRDVVITIMGTVGRTCVLPDDIGSALSSKHIWTMTFDQDRYLPELVSLQLNHAEWVQRHFTRHSQGAVMEAIRSNVLRSVPLPVPPMREQRQIHKILYSTTSSQSTNRDVLNRLQQLKRGLMQDLLTGRVRVPLD